MKTTLYTGWVDLETEATLKLDLPLQEWYFSNPIWQDENGQRIPQKEQRHIAKIILDELTRERHEEKLAIDISLALMKDIQRIELNNKANGPRYQVKAETLELVGARIDMVNRTIQLEYHFIECDREGRLCPPEIIKGEPVQFHRMLYGNVYSISPKYNSVQFFAGSPQGFCIPW